MIGLGLLLVAVAVVGAAQARESVYVTFRMPSGNIACGYSTDFGPVTLRCDQARAAGIDQVLARSAFSDKLGDILTNAGSPPKPPG